MQINTIKLKNGRKKKKTIGRGGKKGTYSGRGNKGQKARSGGNVNPLFEGGRSTLVDHMKKKRGFKSKNPKKNVVKLEALEKKFKEGDIINQEAFIKSGLVRAIDVRNGIKILGTGELGIKLTIDENILLSKSAKAAIEKAGGKVMSGQGAVSKEQE